MEEYSFIAIILSYLLFSLYLKVVVPVRVSSMGQIDLFKKYLYSIEPSADWDVIKQRNGNFELCIEKKKLKRNAIALLRNLAFQVADNLYVKSYM